MPPKSIKLKEKLGDDLREYEMRKQWETFCKGPEIVHNKPYPTLSDSEANRDIEIAENTLNPELKIIC